MKNRIRRYTSLLLVIISTIALFVNILPFKGSQAEADSNIATWILCGSEDGKTIYNAATTDLVPYSIRSKSVGATTDRIDSALNLVLTASGFDFNKVNKAVLGRDVNPLKGADDADTEGAKETSKPTATHPNKTAPKVNPFDRFGVAGLRWSSYNGEWKYYDVNGCAAKSEVSKTEYGKFYSMRKEPKSTYDAIHNSADPRTEQFVRGTFSAWVAQFNDLVTNAVFSITKAIVAFTVALISLAFTDITSLLGLDTYNGGFIGMFKQLYSGVYMPLLMFMMLLTAIYVMYQGLLKRQFREAIVNGLGMSILCIFLGIVIGTKPEFWVPLPNQVATYGEAAVVTALGANAKNGTGWCETSVGDMKKTKVRAGNLAQTKADLERVGTNMRSVIGCRMWQEFLVKPWSKAQFGKEYTELDASKMTNHNKEWVGTPKVPVGKNKTIDNWALFQISAQTNAHAQINDEDSKWVDDPEKNKMTLVDGMTPDWWRIVDAFSNYDESDKPDDMKNSTIVTGQVSGDSKELMDNQVKGLKVLPEWESWVGNRSVERYGTAFLSVFFAGVGSIGPLVFAFIAAIYSIGVTLLMAVAPIFLLFGAWAGNGRKIFMGWLSLLASVMVKKIISAAMIMLSFSIVMACMDLVDKIGWIQACLLMAIMTFVTIKSRHQIMDTFARFNFGGGGFDPSRGFNQVMDRATGVVQRAGGLGMGTAFGAIQGSRIGLGAREGAKTAFGEQGKLLLRRSKIGRAAYQQYTEDADAESLLATEGIGSTRDGIPCSNCERVIEFGTRAYVDDAMNYYCQQCGDEMDRDLYEITLPEPKKTIEKGPEAALRSAKRGQLYSGAGEQNSIVRTGLLKTHNKSYMSYAAMSTQSDVKVNDNGQIEWNDKKINNFVNKNMENLQKDIVQFEALRRLQGDRVTAPSVPEPIREYLDPTIINQAWHSGQENLVTASYQQAWMQWYDDNASQVANATPEKRVAFASAVGLNADGTPVNAPRPGSGTDIDAVDFKDLEKYADLEEASRINKHEDKYRKKGKPRKPKSGDDNTPPDNPDGDGGGNNTPPVKPVKPEGGENESPLDSVDDGTKKPNLDNKDTEPPKPTRLDGTDKASDNPPADTADSVDKPASEPVPPVKPSAGDTEIDVPEAESKPEPKPKAPAQPLPDMKPEPRSEDTIKPRNNPTLDDLPKLGDDLPPTYNRLPKFHPKK